MTFEMYSYFKSAGWVMLCCGSLSECVRLQKTLGKSRKYLIRKFNVS